MTEEPFVPRNRLEIDIVEAMAGRVAMRELLRLFVSSDIAIPSATEVLADGSGFNPLTFDKEGVPMVAVFTDLERAKSLQAHANCYALNKAGKFIERFTAGFGLVVNPGFSAGFEISPAGIQEIVRDFCQS